MGGGGSSTTNNYSPEQRKLQKGFASFAMPDDENFRQAPQFSDQQIYQRGNASVAGLNQGHRTAQGTALSAASGWENSSNVAAQALSNSAQNYTGFAGGPNWSQQTVSRFMMPGVDLVLNPALNELHTAYAKGNTQILGDAASRGALYNDRTGVAQANLGSSYAQNVANTVGGMYQGLYDRAVSQYNTDYDQTLQAMGFNRDTVNQNNTTNATFANNAMTLANQRQQLGGNAANMIAGVADMDRNYQQQILDAGRAGLQADEDYPLKIMQAAQGYMMTPESTTSKQSSGAGGFLGPVASIAGAFISDPDAKEKVRKADVDSLIKRYAKGPKEFEYTAEAKAKGAPAGRHTGVMFDDDYHKHGGETEDVGGYRGKSVHAQVMELSAVVSALAKKSMDLNKPRKAS